jgi:hypothetical protein
MANATVAADGLRDESVEIIEKLRIWNYRRASDGVSNHG